LTRDRRPRPRPLPAAGAGRGHLNGRYADPVWPLAPLTDNPSDLRMTIRWDQWPAAFRDEMKAAAWNLINGHLRPTIQRGHGTRMRSRLGMKTIHETARHWRLLASWLDGRGIRTLAGCDASVLHDYGQRVRDSGRSRKDVLAILVALTRLWAMGNLGGRPGGIARPPWEDRGVDDYLPPATTSGGGENATDPITEQTMGPLLTWAMRMVDDLSGDILAAWAERQRITAAARANTATPAGQAALEARLRPLIDAQAPLPAVTANGEAALARLYIGGITGASERQVGVFAIREGLVSAAAQRPGPCPLDIPVTGQIAGRPWQAALDFAEVPDLIRHLAAAAFTVCGFLTGMRPGEILGLRTGCCPDPVPGPDGRTGGHLIRGREFKTATDEDGNHLSGGAEREVPWVAITPVVNAIRVLERMVPDGDLLFGQQAHDLRGRADHGSLKTRTLGQRIEDFAAWANREAARHGLPGEVIPADPRGSIGTARFRRSLAWHIARRPNGLVALAIQYGHLRTGLFDWTTEGYASRGRDGIHDLIDLETARAVADTVAGLHDSLEAGSGISGPAARRAIRAAAAAPRFAGTPITLASARKLLKNEDAMIYDNPRALVLCHYKRDKALCHRDGVRDTPSLDRCVPGCGNIARIDAQAAQLRERAAALEIQAGHVPQPVGDRLRATAAKLREQAGKHDRDRITPGRAGG
jgi:integrase